jgi:orotidine-5'-phosphate decarboxylase
MTEPSPVFCALDRPDLDGALGLCRSLQGVVGGFKVGLEFMTANGPDGVRRVVALGLPVFLDGKFHDIPNTVAGAVRAAASLDVAMLTLHVAGGPAMLRAAVEAAHLQEPCPKLLGVTVLTSLDNADLAGLGVPHKVTDQVLRLAELAWSAGLDGVVCSPREVPLLRECFGREFKLVVPGIRPRAFARGDQKRTMSPAETIAAGADLLVIGRPITEAAEPRAAAAAIGAEIQALRAA